MLNILTLKDPVLARLQGSWYQPFAEALYFVHEYV